MPMLYSVTADSNQEGQAEVQARSNRYPFSIKPNDADQAGPAELLLSAFAACCLKNVERFSSVLHYTYENASIEVSGVRQEKPPMFTQIDFVLWIESSSINTDLLLKNLQKFGTIYNTLSAVCEINGSIKVKSNV